MASGLFGCGYYSSGFMSWDHLAVAATILMVKMEVLTCYLRADER